MSHFLWWFFVEYPLGFMLYMFGGVAVAFLVTAGLDSFSRPFTTEQRLVAGVALWLFSPIVLAAGISMLVLYGSWRLLTTMARGSAQWYAMFTSAPKPQPIVPQSDSYALAAEQEVETLLKDTEP